MKMPMPQRMRHARRFAMLHVAGYVGGVAAWIVIESVIDPVNFYDNMKFSVGTLIAIYAIFALVTGAVSGIGALVGGAVWAAVPAGRWYWVLAAGSGVLTLGGVIVAAVLFEIRLATLIGMVVLALAGFASAGVLRAVSGVFGLARPWYPPGACRSCGYDLRHTAGDRGCPECGAAIER
ncbi:MAG: hypothetical protein ACPGYV_10185 [Phycisphaeraceae bacterium]